MPKERSVPIMQPFQFINKMDALVEEFSTVTQEDVKKFWADNRYSVYETFVNSDKWVSFYNLIADIVEEYEK